MAKKKTETAGWDCLSVTKVMVFPFHTGTLGNIRAIAQIILNDQLVIRGLRVMDGVNGLYVSYPVDHFYKGDDFKCVCNPTTKALREHIEACVLEMYQQSTDGITGGTGNSDIDHFRRQ
jgi:stage V sporulation protein G